MYRVIRLRLKNHVSLLSKRDHWAASHCNHHLTNHFSKLSIEFEFYVAPTNVPLSVLRAFRVLFEPLLRFLSTLVFSAFRFVAAKFGRLFSRYDHASRCFLTSQLTCSISSAVFCVEVCSALASLSSKSNLKRFLSESKAWVRAFCASLAFSALSYAPYKVYSLL